MMPETTEKREHGIRVAARYLLASVMTVVFIFPLYFCLVSSFKDNNSIFTNPFALPKSFSVANYVQAWVMADIGRAFLNSTIISVTSVFLCVSLGAMAAYILSKFVFRLKKGIYMYILAGMMIPIQSVIIPLSYTVARIHIQDSFLFIILLFTAFYLPFSTFILTGFMTTIPSSLEESAIMDGCSPFRLFVQIILPLIKPAIATVSIFVFMYTWNDLLVPLVFIGNPKLRTLSLGLVNFVGQFQGDYGSLMAAIVISIAPPMLIYIFLQNSVEKGITAGAVKG